VTRGDERKAKTKQIPRYARDDNGSGEHDPDKSRDKLYRAAAKKGKKAR